MDTSFLFCAILLIFNHHLSCHAEETLVDKLLRMMREGDQQIDLGSYENHVVVLGVTGAGKSTVVNVLAGDNTKLKAVKVKYKYVFEDGGEKVSSANETSKSKTFHPEVTYDNETNTAFVDCPGFSNTRSVQHEIASAYFISKVFVHIRNIKIMLVVEQNSVESGGSRTDFVKLVNYIANMFPNIDRMKRSFHIVVTKVRNEQDYSDSNAIEETKDFISSASNSIKEKIKDLKGKVREENEVARLSKLLNVVITLDHFASISIARKPNVAGPVSEIPFIQKEKQITKEYLRKLSYVTEIRVDIRSSLSSKAILFVRDELISPAVERLSIELKNASNDISNAFIVKAAKIGDSEISTFVDDLQNKYTKLSDLKCLSCDKFPDYVYIQFNITQTNFQNETIDHLLGQFQFLCSVQEIEINHILLTAFSKHKQTLHNLYLWFDLIDIFGDEFSIFIESEEIDNQKLIDFKIYSNSIEIFLGKATLISTRMANKIKTIRTSGQNIPVDEIIVRKINSVIDAKIEFIRNIILPSKENKLTQYLSNLSQLMIFNLKRHFHDLSGREEQTKIVQSNFDSYNKLKNIKSYHQFIELVGSCFKNYSSLYQREEIKFHLKSYIKYFSLIGDASELDYNMFVKEFEAYFKYLENLKTVFALIQCVHNWAASYEYQNTKSIYFDDNNLKTNQAFGIFVRSNFPICSGFDISEFYETEIIILRKYFKSVLKSRVKYEAHDHVLNIHAKFITATEVLEKINQDNIVNFSRINIFVSDTIFIDADINFHIDHDLQLNIFAPTWRIEAGTIISLNGKNQTSTDNGQPFSEDNRMKFRNKREGWEESFGNPDFLRNYHSPGEDGAPGLPGSNGGNIFAIAQNIYGENLLTLKSIGGRGGRGQDGGNGRHGLDVEIPYYMKTRQFFDDIVAKKIKKGNVTRYLIYDAEKTYGDEIGSPSEHTSFKLMYYGGTIGMNGGNGGRGGLGGNSGLINILSPRNIWINRKIIRNIGDTGIGGTAGLGGIGGKVRAGLSYSLERSIFFLGVHLINSFNMQDLIHEDVDERHRSGRNGVDNYNTLNIVQPKIVSMSVGSDLVNYIDYIVTSDVPQMSAYIDLIIQPRAERYVTSREIVNTVVRFMNKLPQLHNGVIRSVGDVLIQNIDVYFNIEQDANVKNLLEVAKMALLSTMENTDEKQKQYHVTNLRGYVSEMKSTVERIRSVGNLEAKNMAKSQYDGEINKDLDLLRRYLSTDVSVEFEKMNSDLQNFVTSIESEIRSQISTAANDKAALISTAKKVRDAAWKKNLFSVLNSCVDIVGAFVPPAGRLLGSATNIAESLTRDKITIPKLHSTTMSSLRKFDKSIEYLSNKLNFHETKTKSLIENLDVTFKKYPNETKQLSRAVHTLSLQYFKNGTSTTSRMQLGNQIESIVDNSIVLFETLIKTSNVTVNNINISTNKKILSSIKFAKRTAKFVGPAVNLFSSIMENQAADDQMLNDIAKEIERKENDVNDLNNFQQRIHRNIIPILKNLQNNVATLSNPTQRSSRHELDIGKWKINSAVTDIKFEMGRFLESFESAHEFKRYISKLSDLSDLVSLLYQRLEGYFERLRLSQYIHDVNTYDFDALANSDPAFRTNLRQLNLASKCNVLLSMEKKIFTSLKMNLFPFTDSFIFYKLNHGKNDKNLFQLTTEVTANLDEVRVTLNGLYNKIGNTDKHIFTTQFSKNQSVGAFALWENKNHKSKINSFLSGSEVFFKSKFSKFNAVKFQAIHLEIYANDLERQSNLSKILENFRIEMTHSGQSYYRCDFQYFVVQSSPLTISYGFKYLDGTRNRTHTNRVYNKLSHNEITLSPYTWWGFKLIELSPGSFIKLQPHLGQVHLALEGYGEYIPLNAEVCGTDLVQHYEEYVGLDMEFNST